MELRNQVEWALHCCTVLAGFGPEQRISTKALAEFHGVPKEYLSKALQSLAQAGLVEGRLGPQGGYCLAKPADKITVLDVIEAIEGKKITFQCENIRFNNPCLGPKSKRDKGICDVAKVMYRADEAWRNELRKVTIADIGQSVMRSVDPQVLQNSAEWLIKR